MKKPMQLKDVIPCVGLISILIFFDICVILEIHLILPIIGFLCVILIPGYLLYNISNGKTQSISKIISYSLGLSLALIYAIGLILNSLYPAVRYPLNEESLLAAYNILYIILLVISITYNAPNKIYIKNIIPTFKEINVLTILSILCLPLAAVFGTYLMNEYNINYINIIILSIIIPSLCVYLLLTHTRKEIYYITALFAITLATFIIMGLRSTTLSAGACNIEFFFFKECLQALHWDPYIVSRVLAEYNSCLSITILPTVLYIFTKMNEIEIFRLIYNIIAAFIPIIGYTIFIKYLKPKYAFISAIFLVFQYPLLSMLGWIGFRQLIALLFFYLVILALLDEEISQDLRKLFVIIFSIGVIFSHYATAYVLLIILSIFWISTTILSIIKKNRNNNQKIAASSNTVWWLIVIITPVVLFWHVLIVSPVFDEFGSFVLKNFENILVIDIENLQSNNIILIDSKSNLPAILTNVIYKLSLSIIGVGVIATLYLRIIKKPQNAEIKCFKKFFDDTFLLLIFISFILLIIMSVISSFIIGYGADRIYMQCMIFMAPCFVIGIFTISYILSNNLPHPPNIKILFNIFLLAALLLHIFASTYLIYQFNGVQYSEFLNSEGPRHDLYYVYEVDENGAKWINSKYESNGGILADVPGVFINYKYNPEETYYLKPNIPLNKQYIYLRNINVNNKELIKSYFGDFYWNESEVEQFEMEIERNSKIFNNGGANIILGDPT